MAQVGYRQLAKGTVIAFERDFLVKNPRSSVCARDVLQVDASPCRDRHVGNGREQLLGTAPEGNEVNASLVQLVEVGIRGEFGVKNQFVWHMAGALLPIGDKLENLVILLLFTQLPIGIAKDTGVSIVSQKGQHPLLAAAAFGDVMLLHQGTLAMKRNGME